MSLRTEGHDHRAGAADPHDLALEYAELRRIDEVVGGIDRQQRRTNLAQAADRVVVARGVELRTAGRSRRVFQLAAMVLSR